MGKPKDKVWSLYEQKRDQSISCKFCKINYKFANATKMKKHILVCSKCPNEAKKSAQLIDQADSVDLQTPTLNKKKKPNLQNFVDTINDEENVSLQLY